MGKKMSHPVPTRRCGYQFMDGVIQRWVVGAPQTPEVFARNCPKHTKENSFGKPSTVQPPILPTSKTSNHLVIPVFKESRHDIRGMGNPSGKFQTPYSSQFPDILRILIQANAYPKKISVTNALKKKVQGKKKGQRGEERETSRPHLFESLKEHLVVFRT